MSTWYSLVFRIGERGTELWSVVVFARVRTNKAEYLQGLFWHGDRSSVSGVDVDFAPSAPFLTRVVLLPDVFSLTIQAL